MTMQIIVPKTSELTEVKKADRRAAPVGQKRGELISTPYEGGPAQHHDIVQCCHCQRVWVYQRGSGIERGWCMRCNGITCGSHDCDVCVPAEQMLASMGAGMDYATARKHRPIAVSVPVETPKAAPKIILGRA